MRAILDTSVLLAPAPAPLDGELAISSASLAELHFGVLVAGSSDRRAERLRRLGARLATRNASDLAGLEDLVEIVDLG